MTTFMTVVLVLVFVGGLVHSARRQRSDAREGVKRFGGCALHGTQLRVGGVERTVTRSTRAEVVGAVHEGRRSTVTRTAAGAVVAGPVGAIVGHASKKKTRSSSAVLTINGATWTHTIDVGAKDYPAAVRFAQQVNLAARTSTR